MTLVCRYVDTDLTTVLLDLNGSSDWTGAGFAVMGDPDFGPINRSVSLLRQQGVDGAVLASASNDVTVMTLTTAVRGQTTVSVDQVVDLWRRLAFRVQAGGFIEVRLPGESDSRFFRTISSGIANLIAGQKDAVLHVAGGAFETSPAPLAIMLQPGAYLTPRLGAVQLLTNASMLVDSNADGRPDGYSYSATTGITAEAISNTFLAYAVTRNSTTSIDLRFPTFAVTVGQPYAASFYASADVAGRSSIRPVIQWLDGGGGVLSEAVGTLTAIAPVVSIADRPRLTVSGTAPASSVTARIVARMANPSASAVTTYLAQGQGENASVATAWRLGFETSGNAVATGSLPFNCRILLHNPGNTWGLVKLTADPSAGNVSQMRAFLRSYNRPKGEIANITSYLNTYSLGYEAEALTLSTGTASAVVAAASGGHVAQTTFTAPPANDQGQLVQCWSVPHGPAANVLDGTWGVWAVISTTAAAKFRVGFRTLVGPGAGIQSPVASPDPVVYDTTNIAAGDLAQYSLVPLGTFTIDTDRGDNGAVIQGWASLETAGSAAKLNWDCIFVLPADELVSAYTEPGIVPGGVIDDEWGGWQLVKPTDPGALNAGTVVGQIMVLNALDETGGTPPTTGFKLPAGRHTVACDVSLFTQDTHKLTLSQLVARIVGAPGTTIKTVNLTSIEGNRWSHLNNPMPALQFDIPGDAATTDFLEFYVRETAATATGRQTDVYKITHTAQQSASGGSDQPFIVDAVIRQAYVKQGTQLARRGDFVSIPPGYSVLSLFQLDRPNMGFEAVFVGAQGPEPMCSFVAARAFAAKRDTTPQVAPF